MIWNSVLGYDDLPEVCYSGQQTLDGGYILGAYTASIGDMLLIKTDFNGQEVWMRTYGNAQLTDNCSEVQQTLDGGYILVGQSYTGSDEQVYIVKTDYAGNETWNLHIGDADADGGLCIRQIYDGGYIATGWYGGPWTWDVYLIRLAPEGVGVQPENGEKHPTRFAVYPAYPDPFNPSTTIRFDLPSAGEAKLDVFDVAGRHAGENILVTREPGTYAITFDGSYLASGIYFYRLTAGELIGTGKMMLIR